MEQIVITHLNNTTTLLNSKEQGSYITRASQNVELLGADTVDISVDSAAKLQFYIGDKIHIFGRDYTLNIAPTENKRADNRFSYDLQFEGVQYDMLRATYSVNVDTTSNEIQDLNGDSLTGDLKRFLDVLISNLNRVFPNKWHLGTYPATTETRTETFSDSDNCLSVLQSLCGEDKYNTEFNISIATDGKRTLNVGASGTLHTYTFEHGKGRGIYELSRQKVSSSNIVTRLSVYGSSKNIMTTKYRAFKLCLPGKTKSQSYLESAAGIAAYGVWEQTKNFEDVYPHRVGVVTALGSDELTFADTTTGANAMFDLNEKEADNVTTKYLIAGTSAKVHFNTGNLAGYDFEIESYNHGTKTFRIKPFTDENGYVFPSKTSEAFQAKTGDQYALVDIYMPTTYVDAAEAELLAKGNEYLAKYGQPLVSYGLTLDEMFLRELFGGEVGANIIWAGDYIPIKDTDIDVDKTIRVKGFTRDLMRDCAYTVTIADLPITVSMISRVVGELKAIDNVVKMNNLNDPARARRNYLAAQEVLSMVFDPEGDFYTDKIKPLSIDTTMLSVGAKSMQFGLDGTIFQPNFGGGATNKNRVKYTGGALVHYAILDGENPRVWNITDGDVTVTTDAAYYVYAKCARVGTGAVILFSTSKLLVESDGAYYHFLIGVLNSVDTNNARALSLMYGFTTVNGRFIKTGRIQSADGNTYFDLDANEIGGKIYFKDGLVSGEVGVGPDSSSINAGMSGAGTLDTSVRIWAGATAANKATAPFRVLKDGTVVMTKGQMTNADISGNVEAETGTIGNWAISSGGIFNDTDEAYIIARKSGAGGYCESRIGANVMSATTGLSIPAWLMNTIENIYGVNIALLLTAKHGTYNIAALAEGSIVANNGAVISTKINYINLFSGSPNVIELLNGTNIHVRNISGATRALYLPTKAQILTSLQRGTAGTSTCTAYMSSVAGSAYYWINKGNGLVIGDAIKYGASAYQRITEIDRTNAGYDLVTTESILGVAVTAGGTFTYFKEFSIEMTIAGESLESGQDLVNVYPNGSTWYNNEGASLSLVALGRGDIIKVIAYTRLSVMYYQLVHYKTA